MAVSGIASRIPAQKEKAVEISLNGLIYAGNDLGSHTLGARNTIGPRGFTSVFG
jgi:hypothetical protein